MKQLLILFILFIQASFSQAATITAKTDRNPVQINESFNLIFEAKGSIDDEPDFSKLENDFSIINQSQGSSISIINGSYSRTTRWTLLLMPKNEGILTIPSIAFGKDLSPQLRLTVKPQNTSAGGQTSDLFMELETSAENTWVQAQIILTVRLLSASNISQFGISQLKTNSMDLVIEKLGDDKRYQTNRGNTPYLVFERKFAIFPQQAGTLVIEPFVGEVEIISGSSSYFDPFSRKSKIKRTSSRPVSIAVSGIPRQFTGKTWLPASELKLVEEWSQDTSRFKAGEPITRTLSLFANGLTSAQLPELHIPSVDGLKQYPDQPLLKDNKQNDGIIGARQEKIAVIPTQKGTYKLPAIEIPWWNTTTGKMEIARISPQTIHAARGALKQTAPVNEVRQKEPAMTTSADIKPGHQMFWFWLSLILATGWFTTVIIWWFSSRKNTADKKSHQASTQLNLKQAKQLIDKACKNNDATACRQALLEWGKLIFKNKPANLMELATSAGEPLASHINALNQALYGPSPANWSPGEMMQVITELHNRKQTTKSETQYSLEPMYK